MITCLNCVSGKTAHAVGSRGSQVELVALLSIVVSYCHITNHPKLHGREQPPHLTESVDQEFAQSTAMRASLSTMRGGAAAGKIEMTGGNARLRTRITWRCLHSRAVSKIHDAR